MEEEYDSPEENLDEDEKTDDVSVESPKRRATVLDTVAADVPEADILSVVVCDPEERADNRGLTKWIEYKTITEYSDGNQIEVFRRYNHFLWLRQLLLEEFKGIMVPPLPEKKNLGRFEASFVERRRRRLEQFLNRLRVHPFLKTANAFRVFLNVQESDMFKQVLKGDPTTYSERASSLYQSYRTSKQRLVHSVSSDYEFTEVDEECKKIKNYGTNLETIARNLEQACFDLDTDLRANGDFWTRTAESLEQMSQFESEEGNEAAAACLLAFQETCERVAALSENPESQSTFTTIKLRDLFDDISKYGRAIKECCQGRDSLFYQCRAEQATLASLQTNLETLENGKWTYNRESRCASTQESIEASQEKVEVVEQELNEVSERLQSEVHDFQQTKPERIENQVARFADYQIEHLTEMVRYWTDLRDRISQGEN